LSVEEASKLRVEPVDTGARVRGRKSTYADHRIHHPRHSFELRLKPAWAYRHAIPFFGMRVVDKRFRGTWLGWLWIPLRPALQMFSKAFVFGGLLGVGSGDRPYLIFLMVGQASWDFFDRMVYWGFRGIRTNRRILDRAPIPWAVAVTSTVVPATLDALPFVVIGALVSLYYKLAQGSFYITLSPLSVVRLVGGLALLAAWGIALSLVVSPLIIMVRDIRFVIRYVISFLYFLTPVLYAISSLPAEYRVLATYNPISAPIEMIKDNLLETGPPATASVVVSLAALIVVFPLGLLVCSFAERRAHARL
jgi:lipopolysaccharide transport system permease protein